MGHVYRHICDCLKQDDMVEGVDSDIKLDEQVSDPYAYNRVS